MSSFFDKFKKKKKDDKGDERKEVKEIKKEERKIEKKEPEEPAEKDEVKKEKPEKKKSLKKKDTEAYKYLLKPLITEKATDLSAQNQYVFLVPKSANKIDIAKKVEHVYGVTPVKVRTINYSGKNVRYGRTRGRRKSWKKAIVYLNPEDKIEIYEGV